MVIASRIELETAADTWTSLDKWAIGFDSFSGRRGGLGAHRAGNSTLSLRVLPGDTSVPVSLGNLAQPATAQGDRLRVYLKPGTETEHLIWLGWVTDVRWFGKESLFYCEVTTTDALGRLGPVEVDYPSRASELTGARLTAILTAAGWSYGSNLDDGNTMMVDTQNASPRRDSAVRFCQNVALSDPGVLCARPSLTAPLRFLANRYEPARSIVISDQEFTSGVRWGVRPAFESAEDYLVNMVVYTEREDNNRHILENDASVEAYGRRRIDRSFESVAADAATVAGNILRSYSAPTSIPREARVVLHFETDSAASNAAAIQIGDQVDAIMVSLDGTPVTAQTLVDGIEWRLSPLFGEGVTAFLQFHLIPPFGSAVSLAPLMPILPDLFAPAGLYWTYTLTTAVGGSGMGYTYALTGTPTWLSFNADTRKMSGTAPYSGDPWELTYTATDKESAATVSSTFDLHLSHAPLRLPDIEDIVVVIKEQVNIDLPAASAGSGSYTYSASNLPSWALLVFRMLRGKAPDTPQPFQLVTYTATDTTDGLSASITFGITVVMGTVHLPSIGNQSATAGTRWTFQLPNATGGSGEGFTYQLISKPTWLQVLPPTSAGSTVTGIPPYRTSDYSINLVWIATDTANGLKASKPFRLNVESTQTSLASVPNQEVRVRESLDVLLTEASGGSGTFTYQVMGLQTWMSFDPDTRRLTGTAPNAPSVTTLTYIAFDSETRGSVRISFLVTVVDHPILPIPDTITVNPTPLRGSRGGLTTWRPTLIRFEWDAPTEGQFDPSQVSVEIRRQEDSGSGWGPTLKQEIAVRFINNRRVEVQTYLYGFTPLNDIIRRYDIRVSTVWVSLTSPPSKIVHIDITKDTSANYVWSTSNEWRLT